MSEINIGTLNYAQLDVLRKQLEEEIALFSSNYSDLKSAQQQFYGSLVAVEEIGAATGGEDILVPLTSSLYVPGKLVKNSDILVDIGAGFYVGRSTTDAKAILSRKVAYLKNNTDGLSKMINSRQQNLAIVKDTMVTRRQQMGPAGGAGGAGGQ